MNHDQMAVARFNFQQCSVLWEFHILQIFCFLSILLYTVQIKFSNSITLIYTGFK